MTENRPLRVFLCHSSHDKPIVRDLFRRLDAEGWIDAWLDVEKLYPGQDWNFEIENAVEAADIILVCLSKTSVNKEGYIQRELRLVLDVALNMPEGTIFTIPLRLEDCELPRRLRAWQWLDFFPPEARPEAYERLLASLKVRADKLGISTEGPSAGTKVESTSTPRKFSLAVETEHDKTKGESVPVFVSSRSKSFNFRLYGIGAGILLLVVLGQAGINAWANRRNEISTPTMTRQAVADTPTTKPFLTAPVSTYPGFVQADYVNIVHPCPQTQTWWVRISLTNNFNSTLKSVSISVKDTETGDIAVTPDNPDPFVDRDQSICNPDIEVGNDSILDNLEPNQSFMVSSGVFRKDPMYHSMVATLTLCTEENLKGQCITKTIVFTPGSTVQPTSPYIILSAGTNCRTGPGAGYDIIGGYAPDTKIPVLGKDPTGKYWVVASPYKNDNYPKCWLPSTYIKEFGNLDNVAIYPVPPTPTLTSPTATP